MLILIWFVVCIIFYLVQKILGNSGHALELFALVTALALFFIDRLSRKKKMRKYLVIGNPIEHSLSPLLHNFWFKNIQS